MHTTTQHDQLYITTITLGALATNCYFIWDRTSRQAIIIDSADAGEFLAQMIGEIDLKPTAIIFTHAHFDHILGSFALATLLQLPTWLHPADASLLRKAQKSAEYWLKHPVDPVLPVNNTITSRTEFSLGKKQVKVLHLPGHTPGGIGIGVFSGAAPFICSGDLITDQGIGAATHTYSNKKDLKNSLKKLTKLPTNTTYYPGHGKPLKQIEIKAILAQHLGDSVQ